MDNEQFKQFYREIDSVCRKFKIAGLVGVWFHGPTDIMGFMRIHDITDTQMSTVCKVIQDKLEGWIGDLAPPDTQGSINEISTGGQPLDN